ncbi:MAG TPA: GNAT family N-acetyltransferase [Steroidobacteraceae bacterium]
MYGLRRAAVRDIQAIWEVRRLAIEVGCREYYSDDDIQRWATLPLYEGFPAVVEQTEFYVMAEASRIAAFGSLDLLKAEIGAMFVHPDFQGLGLGRRLLATLEDVGVKSALPSISLVATLNAERFYAAAGFKSQDRIKWKHPAGFELDCVPMRKNMEAVDDVS